MKTNNLFCSFFSLVFCLLVLLLISGCDYLDRFFKKPAAASLKSPAIKVEVMKPLQRTIIDYEEFTGETKPVDQVTIKAQVAGMLTKCSFIEGAEVKKDDLLFEIDPEVYQAVLENSKGNLQSVEWQLVALEAREDQLRKEKERQATLIESKTVSAYEHENAVAAYNECLAHIQKAKADITKAQAEVSRAELDLKYTKILSPINGFISRQMVTEGNLIQPHSNSNSLMMAQVVSLDPIYVFFFVDETTYLRLVAITQNRASSESGIANSTALNIEFRLMNEEQYIDKAGTPYHSGVIQYADPFMDESSGTVLLRATCRNLKQGNGMNKIIPGMVVHVRIPVTENYSAILVPEEALGSEQGTRYVYVVDEQNKAQMRRLELGPLQSDNMRVVRKGLTSEDTVIVSGLLRLRPGSDLSIKETSLEKLRF